MFFYKYTKKFSYEELMLKFLQYSAWIYFLMCTAHAMDLSHLENGWKNENNTKHYMSVAPIALDEKTDNIPVTKVSTPNYMLRGIAFTALGAATYVPSFYLTLKSSHSDDMAFAAAVYTTITIFPFVSYCSVNASRNFHKAYKIDIFNHTQSCTSLVLTLTSIITHLCTETAISSLLWEYRKTPEDYLKRFALGLIVCDMAFQGFLIYATRTKEYR